MKMFVCEFCGKKFLSKVGLESHVITMREIGMGHKSPFEDFIKNDKVM
jgi:hypothetical protein